MPDYKLYASRPIFFERNRVARVYTGGKLFGDFLGDPPVDSYMPEEWVASGVRAINRGSTDIREGISRVEGTNVYFDELLEICKADILGERDSLDLLVKFLDSAVRLPVQAHPDKEFARKHFNSEYGKTEMWVVLGTRENAKIYYGFNRKITSEEFSDAIERSLADKDCLPSYLNEVNVKKGDVFLIPGRVAHAIGAGCLILELQEPTDLIVQPEYWCDEYRLNNSEMYMHLTKAESMGCFDFDRYGTGVVEAGRKLPVTVSKSDAVHTEKLLNEADGGCFALYRHTVSGGSVTLQNGPAVYIVSDGNGTLYGDTYTREVKKGDYFFMPAVCKGKFYVKSENNIEIMECLPPHTDSK